MNSCKIEIFFAFQGTKLDSRKGSWVGDLISTAEFSETLVIGFGEAKLRGSTKLELPVFVRGLEGAFVRGSEEVDLEAKPRGSTKFPLLVFVIGSPDEVLVKGSL